MYHWYLNHTLKMTKNNKSYHTIPTKERNEVDRVVTRKLKHLQKLKQVQLQKKPYKQNSAALMCFKMNILTQNEKYDKVDCLYTDSQYKDMLARTMSEITAGHLDEASISKPEEISPVEVSKTVKPAAEDIVTKKENCKKVEKKPNTLKDSTLLLKNQSIK